MKRLYARFVLWLIRPALGELSRVGLSSSSIRINAEKPIRDARRDFFSRAIESAGDWTPCFRYADRKTKSRIPRPLRD